MSCGPRAVRAELVCPAGWAQLSLSWAARGHSGPALCLPDWIPALSHRHPTPVGWGWGSFVSPFGFSPTPFPLLGFVLEGKRRAPSASAAAAVDLFGQAESKAQPRWFSGRHLFVLTMRVTNCFLLAASFR